MESEINEEDKADKLAFEPLALNENEAELKDLLMKLNKKPHDMIRTQEAIYKSDFKGKTFTDKEWVKILVENPKLIQRPIIIKDDQAVLGDPAENVAQLFKL